MPRYLSGRSKRRPQEDLTEDRYDYLSVDQTEPNLGDPVYPGDSPPLGLQYQIISLESNPGERYWIPIGAGLTTGAISIYDEGVLTPPGGISSTSQLNFVGAAISAQGYSNPDSSPGVAVTVTVFSPGEQGQFMFNDNNDFAGTSSMFYDVSNNNIGIGTTGPERDFHVNGDIRLNGTIYDFFDNAGTASQLLAKNVFGGLTWISQSTITPGAGGTYRSIQYHNTANVVDGAEFFVYDDINHRVGIGSTLPTRRLDVLGETRITGQTEIDYLNVTGFTTTNNFNATNLSVSGLSTFTGLLDANGGATIDNVRIGVANNNEIDTSTGNLTIDSAGGTTTVDDNLVVNQDLTVTGESTVDFINISNANVTGILTVFTLSVVDTELIDLRVTGFATVNAALINNDLTVDGPSVLDSLRVTGISTFTGAIDANGGATIDNIRIGVSGNSEIDTSSGNLILDSAGGTVQVTDNLSVSGSATFNGNIDLGNASSDSITFNGVVDSNVIPSGTIDLGSTSSRWNAVYADTFNGSFVGNADTATALETAREFSITGDVDASAVEFDGTGNVNLVTALDTTGVAADTYGSDTEVGQFTVDSKGRITSASNVGIDFANATVAQSNTVLTASRSTNATHYVTFVDSNNTSGSYESVYTDAGISYNPSTNLLSAGSLAVTGLAEFNGNVDLGNGTSDTITFTGRVDSDIIPSTGNTNDIGTASLKWDKIYANEFVGAIIGNADTATKLATARDFSITGDGSAPAVSFDGSANVSLNLTLSASGVSADTYGNSSTIPQFTVDSKGRITSVTNVGVNFSSATVAQSDKIKRERNSTNANFYIPFVDSNGSSATYESVYTDAGITYNPSTNTLTVPNINSSGSIGGDLSHTLTMGTNGNGISGSATFDNSQDVTFTVTSNATAANTANTIVYRNASGNFNAQDVRVDSFGVGTGASGTTGEIRATNNITGYYSSDINLKENIKPINDALNKLLRINGVNFDWKDDYIEERGGEDGFFVRKNDVGVIAQEIEEVLPEIVATREDGYKAVKYEMIVPLLIESIKEQQNIIEKLTKRVEDLESK